MLLTKLKYSIHLNNNKKELILFLRYRLAYLRERLAEGVEICGYTIKLSDQKSRTKILQSNKTQGWSSFDQRQ